MDEFGCLRSDTLVQTDIGILEIKDFLNGEAQSLLNKDNEFESFCYKRMHKKELTIKEANKLIDDTLNSILAEHK